MGYNLGCLKSLIIVPNLIHLVGAFMLGGCSGYGLFSILPEMIERNAENSMNFFCVVLVLGIVRGCVSLLAIFGALTEKREMLNSYAIIIIFIIFLDVVFVVLLSSALWKNSNCSDAATHCTIMDIDRIGLAIWISTSSFVFLEILTFISTCLLSTRIGKTYQMFYQVNSNWLP